MVYNKINRRAVGPADVHIEVTYSGICHSDIHTAKGEWGDVSKKYPLCVGHEIIGTVKAIGKDVTKFKVCKGEWVCVVGLVVCLVSVCGSWCVRLCVYSCGSMCMWLWHCAMDKVCTAMGCNVAEITREVSTRVFLHVCVGGNGFCDA